MFSSENSVILQKVTNLIEIPRIRYLYIVEQRMRSFLWLLFLGLFSCTKNTELNLGIAGTFNCFKEQNWKPNFAHSYALQKILLRLELGNLILLSLVQLQFCIAPIPVCMFEFSQTGERRIFTHRTLRYDFNRAPEWLFKLNHWRRKLFGLPDQFERSRRRFLQIELRCSETILEEITASYVRIAKIARIAIITRRF